MPARFSLTDEFRESIRETAHRRNFDFDPNGADTYIHGCM
jgi:hypothetical protein